VADLFLSLDAFIRTVGVSRTPHALFLGAGASITSGMPSAQMCIWSGNAISSSQTTSVSSLSFPNSLSQASVNGYNDGLIGRLSTRPRALPTNTASTSRHVIRFQGAGGLIFQEKVRRANPHIGYQLLSILAENSLIRSVWTTNLTNLSESFGSKHGSTNRGCIDSSHRISRPLRTGNS